ncbi:hypothetical protein HYFRA_00011289 [Hymenoscyphus fraxineus]|uniref:GH16 domain-containing protein n=1 Tax=Hymenoscyphus fraxineus TaxID=746836 RepID=A0A9N9L0E4_9HELO|nr:hypothetical protein HYFRA_00011289 [Hymenoscyphus fraxineus]
MPSLLKLSFLAALFSSAIAEIPAKDGYKLHWGDDFNGVGVDHKEWHHESNAGAHTNNELQEYIDSTSTAFTSDGSLKIQPKKSSDGKWTSARIATWRTFTCEKDHKMAIEAEIKLSAAANQQGIWPAFWTLGSSIYGGKPWPRCGEWDIMETRNGLAQNWATIHYGKDGIHKSIGNEANPEPLDRSKFHKYTLEVNRQPDDWQQQTLKWFIDGKNYKTIKGSDVGDVENWVALAQSPVYALFNVAIGGDFGGNPNTQTVSGDKAGMEVNYFGVYYGTQAA